MLSGKTAIITGASRGIGEAIAVNLASHGVHIAALCAGSLEQTQELCRDIHIIHKVRARAYLCDVKDAGQIGDTVTAIKEEFGDIHILVNNAGIKKDGLAVLMSEDDFDLVLDTNLRGAFLMIRSCLPHFVRQREGVIINISSVSGSRGNIGQSNYSASKSGLIGLTKSIAREYAFRGIRCNAVEPGFIDTQMTETLKVPDLISQIPLGRKGMPEEVAQAVSFLADADYITGEILRVDGGFAM